ncbi:hypothetical protein K437DRAFT_265979 [Tilletiaria anomala UBC 951]|uniref:Conidiation-specific protein 10 n=1 Tax=Tilletiaria anomala (strain ATCC 24038 / CBS 436.72 / UBC 951) TaxID=1037660 RepID=A0A066WPV7_TILAU|nr:uncharacterized protein K437DRAFT_265979 [Tilletiaria anomala UBC 951]KDN53039.1 hypothetical protein K437DRAFT_265979 [Tilletiaria anomala UBC 951]
MSSNSNPGTFANRPREEVQDIASKAGSAGDKVVGHGQTAAGGHTGTLSNRPHEEVSEMASKGGRSSNQQSSSVEDDEAYTQSS